MDTTSYWAGTAPEAGFPALRGDVVVDVAIIGGGITGITLAMLLSEAGKSVAVLESRKVGEGTTGYSTGNLYVTVDEMLTSIRDKWDQETVNSVVQSRGEAIALIEQAVAKYGIDCGFVRRDQYLYPTDEKQAEQMRKEHEVAVAAGVAATITQSVPLPFPVKQALKNENQAQFHPLTFTRALARAVASETCAIYEDTKATEIDGGKKRVQTANGTVHAGEIVMATHTPLGFNLVQTVLGPYREYGIAVTLTDEQYPEGIFWSMEEPSHSIRSSEVDGRKRLIVIGEKHKTGQHEADKDYFASVEEFARSHFQVASVDYRWSAQHFRPADGLPYVGHSAGSDEIFIATGFGTNGLVYGPLAAMLISDAILGRENRWKDLYNATRFTPAKSAADFLSENANAAKQYMRDYFTHAEVDAAADVPNGEGKLAQVGNEKLAVYRDENGAVTALSPVCTHLACIVHWNGLEKSWDCPCHGSRFAPDGEVLEGPAISPLKRHDVRE